MDYFPESLLGYPIVKVDCLDLKSNKVEVELEGHKFYYYSNLNTHITEQSLYYKNQWREVCLRCGKVSMESEWIPINELDTNSP